MSESGGTVGAMAARRRVSFSIDEISLEFLQAAADRAGMPLSAWLYDATRREAVRQGAPPERDWDDVAAIDEDSLLAADEATLRASG